MRFASTLTAMAASVMILMGCHTTETTGGVGTRANTPSTGYIPKAVIYQMNGDYSQYVPFTVANGTVASYPAPSDINAGQAPVKLADGWWLDRRGINGNSVFSSYTYAQYPTLSGITPSELMATRLPNGKITRIVKLPLTLSEATRNPEAVNRLIGEGLPGCEVIYQTNNQ